MFQQLEVHFESAVCQLLEEKVYLERVKLDCTQLREQKDSVSGHVADHAANTNNIQFGVFITLLIPQILFTASPEEMLV